METKLKRTTLLELTRWFAELHMSPSQKQKCFTFSLILMSRHPLAVLIPIAFAFISSSLVKQRLLAGVSKIARIWKDTFRKPDSIKPTFRRSNAHVTNHRNRTKPNFEPDQTWHELVIRSGLLWSVGSGLVIRFVHLTWPSRTDSVKWLHYFYHATLAYYSTHVPTLEKLDVWTGL